MDVQDIWKSYNPGPKRAGTISIISTIAIHVFAILLLFVIFRATPAGKKILEYTHLYVHLKPYETNLPRKGDRRRGRGRRKQGADTRQQRSASQICSEAVHAPGSGRPAAEITGPPDYHGGSAETGCSSVWRSAC